MRLAAQPWLTHPATQTLLAAFADVSLRFVGGCVRDALLERPVKDIDAATPLTPEAVMERLHAAGITAIPTGLKHGTITAVIDRHPFEITTLRTDTACDGRHAEVAFTDDWRADAARRDFTMNALYCDAGGEITDFFGGVADARAGHIRFIGDAAARIREDGLRILRFFRFYATHGRGEADAAALAACAYHRGMIETLSGERIQHEMLKLLAAPDPYPSLELMRQTELLQTVIPAHRHALPLAAGNAMVAFIRLSLMLRQCADPADAAQQLSQRWKLSNKDKAVLKRLTLTPTLPATPDDRTIKGFLLSHGREMTAALLMRDAAERGERVSDALLTAIERLPIPQFPLDGSDLLQAGIPQGPALGATLRKLERLWQESGYGLSKQELLDRL